MSNAYQPVSHSREYYKGKSIDFAGVWTAGVKYFNDEFITNFVVCAEKDLAGNITASALLACKKTHLSKVNSANSDPTNNQPILVKSNRAVVGIQPNDYWIYICGSLEGIQGVSSTVVNTYAEALALSTTRSLGELIYVKNPVSQYVVTGQGVLSRVVIGDEVERLDNTKVDKVSGKQLSTEDYTTNEKSKLGSIESGAQVNVIETVKVNNTPLSITEKSVNIPIDSYTIEKLNTPEGNYLASYVFKKSGTKVGSTINIPKDKFVSGGSIEDVVRTGYPYAGAAIGDKYIDLVLNDSPQTHIYIPAKKLSDIYTGDKYISVNGTAKTINLNYQDLVDDLNDDVQVSVGQVTGLNNRLTSLEDPNSKVISLGTDTVNRYGGNLTLNPTQFNIDPAQKVINVSVDFSQLETKDVVSNIKNTLLGNNDDTIDDNSIMGLKNALLNDYISEDDLGAGLKVSNGKLTLDIKEGSSLHVDELTGKLELIWT